MWDQSNTLEQLALKTGYKCMSCTCLVSNTLLAVKDTLQHLLMTLFGVIDGSSPVGRQIYSEQSTGKTLFGVTDGSYQWRIQRGTEGTGPSPPPPKKERERERSSVPLLSISAFIHSPVNC